MAQFLNTTAAFAEIENIINRAEKKLVFITPYLRLPRILYQKLTYAGQSRGVRVIIVCRKKDLPPEEITTFRAFTWMEVLDMPNLHAKCFYNEKTMVISSLNLYGSNPLNSKEIGILLTQEKDPEVFKDVVSEAESIIQMAYQLEAQKLLAKQKQDDEVVSFFDIEGGLKRSFPTFARILGRR